MIKNIYGNARMDWMRKHVTLKSIPEHINSVVVETWEAFKLSSNYTTQYDFDKTKLLPVYTNDEYMNHQY